MLKLKRYNITLEDLESTNIYMLEIVAHNKARAISEVNRIKSIKFKNILTEIVNIELAKDSNTLLYDFVNDRYTPKG